MTIEGVTEYNGKTWQNYPNTGINSAGSIGVSSIAFDSKNKLYVGMSDGSIYLFNGKYQQIKIPDQTHPVQRPPSEQSPPSRLIKTMIFGQINWQGIQRYNGKSWVDSQDIPGFPQGTISFIGADKNDDLWFQDTSDFATTYLYRYDGKTWQKIEMAPTDSEVQSITIDDKGNVWCAALIHYIAIMAKPGKIIAARFVTSVPSPLMTKGTSGAGQIQTEFYVSMVLHGKPISRMISKASTSKLLWPPITTAISGSIQVTA